jgi:hypothetical protein
MTLEQDGLNGLVEIIKIVGGPSAVAGLGYWLRGKFSDIADSSKAQLATHEKQDERRHRQNLVRFMRINAKLGIEDHDEFNGEHEE